MGVLEQKKTFCRAPFAPAVSSQTSESIGPKKLETPRKSRARKRESRGPWCHLKGELVSEKKISHCSEDFHHSARDTGANTAKVGRTTSRLDRLLRHSFRFLFNPKPHVAILKKALEGCPISFSVVAMNSLSSGFTTLSVRLAGWAWLSVPAGAQAPIQTTLSTP